MVETQAAKVDRYIEEGRVVKVNELPDNSSIWRINGDTGTYRVVIDDVGVEWQCSCPAGLKGHSECVHAFAVLKAMGLEPEAGEVVTLDTPVETLDIGVFNDPANHDQQEDELLEIVELLEEPQRTVATLEPTSVTDAPVTWRVIEYIQDTESVPRALRGKPHSIAAAMLLGRDWNLGPFEALAYIDVIEGKLSPSAELLLRLYRRAGHTLEVHQADTEGVILRGQRSDTGERLEVSYMLEDAVQAGLITVSDNGTVTARSGRGNPMPWELYTSDLLWARCVTRLVRRLAPDALDQT